MSADIGSESVPAPAASGLIIKKATERSGQMQENNEIFQLLTAASLRALRGSES
jgi:hypothetical protein